MPTITFQVNLTNPHALDWSQPFSGTGDGGQAAYRVTWLPNYLRNNEEKTDGTQFTVSGMQAIYLKNLYASGVGEFGNLLTVISQVN